MFYFILIAGKTSLITRFVYDSFDSAYQVSMIREGKKVSFSNFVLDDYWN
jgi:GTPase SAR1 family protein